MNTCYSIALIAGASIAAGCQSQSSTASTPAPSPTPAVVAEAAHPLKVGARAPATTVCRPDGTHVDIADLYVKKPCILIFYRGGWCPYCNTHLGQIAAAEPELIKLGYQVLAISPDKPESLRATLDKGAYTYDLLSDSDVKLISAFGLPLQSGLQTAALAGRTPGGGTRRGPQITHGTMSKWMCEQ